MIGDKELSGHQQGWHQANWNLVNDIVTLCDTLDKFKVPTEEEKIALAKKRNPSEPSQADIMGSGKQIK